MLLPRERTRLVFFRLLIHVSRLCPTSSKPVLSTRPDITGHLYKLALLWTLARVARGARRHDAGSGGLCFHSLGLLRHLWIRMFKRMVKLDLPHRPTDRGSTDWDHPRQLTGVRFTRPLRSAYTAVLRAKKGRSAQLERAEPVYGYIGTLAASVRVKRIYDLNLDQKMSSSCGIIAFCVRANTSPSPLPVLGCAATQSSPVWPKTRASPKERLVCAWSMSARACWDYAYIRAAAEARAIATLHSLTEKSGPPVIGTGPSIGHFGEDAKTRGLMGCRGLFRITWDT